jgi:hypothetical protein
VTVQDADAGDTTTSRETLSDAAEQIEAVRPDGDGLTEVVGDKGYRSNQSLVNLEAVGVRSYISEPDRGQRNWKKNPEARDAVYRLGLLMRQLIGVGTPRGLPGRLIAIVTTLWALRARGSARTSISHKP